MTPLDDVEARYFTTRLADDRHPTCCARCDASLDDVEADACRCTGDELREWLAAQPRDRSVATGPRLCSRERARRVDSVGACGLCGYEGPGPAHECRPAMRLMGHVSDIPVFVDVNARRGKPGDIVYYDPAANVFLVHPEDWDLFREGVQLDPEPP